ncbi:MAG TPA: type II secretion system F family protein [Nitrospiria bacterium]|nr:type II secretion system F family protein [Nitrospiria bacterium]
MPTFSCRIATADGTIKEETIEGTSEVNLRESLEKKGYLVFSVRRSLNLFDFLKFSLKKGKRLPPVEFLIFNSELIALIKAGLPILKTFELLEGRMVHPGFREALAEVRKDIAGGSSISDALGRQKAFFPEIYISSVRAGEKSGNLVEILNRYILFYKKILSVRKKVALALTYPAFLSVVGVAVVIFLLTYVLPTFSEIYTDSRQELPWLTQALISLVHFLRVNFIWILLAAAGLIWFFLSWKESKKGRPLWHAFLLKVPMLGELLRIQQIIMVGRTLSTVLKGGIPLVNSLEMVGESLSNEPFKRKISGVIHRVREGIGLSASFSAVSLMPKIAVEMVEVGETTGSLEEMLDQVAEFHEEVLDQKLNRITTWVEPVLLLVMGVVVAVILIAIYLPIFNLAGTIK